MTGADALEVRLEGTDGDIVTVPADEMKLQRIYVLAPPDSDAAHSERTDFRMWVEDTTNADRVYKDTVFNGRSN